MIRKATILPGCLLSTWVSAQVIEPPLVHVPAGDFLMGSEKGKDNEKPVHKVNVQAFYAGKYEVTVEEFRRFIKATGFERSEQGGDSCWTWDSKEYIKPAKGNWDSEFNAPSNFHPVMCISADQAQAYADWLTEQTGKPYRLLTEAEWEYAARANSTGKYFFGDAEEQLCDYGNVFDQSGKAALERDFQISGDFKYANCNDYSSYTSIVGMYRPNGFGLHDTIGNVGELVQDCEHSNYQNAPADGSAWIGECTLFRGEHKMLITRGGAYGLMASPMRVRSANREHFGMGNGEGSSIGEGFRVALDIIGNQPHQVSVATQAFERQLSKAQEAEIKRRKEGL